jgi:hypothetical protein
MPAVCTMSMVHEQMHQRTGEQQQERQRTKQMGTVFGKQIKSSDRQKGNENPVVAPWGAVCTVPGGSSGFNMFSFQKKVHIIEKITRIIRDEPHFLGGRLGVP